MRRTLLTLAYQWTRYHCPTPTPIRTNQIQKHGCQTFSRRYLPIWFCPTSFHWTGRYILIDAFLFKMLDVEHKPYADSSIYRMTVAQSNDDELFAPARTIEFNGLIDWGVFTLVPISAADGHRIYNARRLKSIKNEGTLHVFTKPRFVVMACNDKKHGLLTSASTVQRSW